MLSVSVNPIDESYGHAKIR